MTFQRMRAAAYGAGITIVALFGGLLLGVVIGNVVFEAMSGHVFVNPNPTHIIAAALPALAGFIGGSALWSVLMGRLANAREPKRMALAGALGFAPITLTLALLLQVLEPLALRQFGEIIPLHRLFTLLFVPTAFLIAGVSAFAVGIGLRDRALAWQLFWRVGVSAAIAFFLVNLTMEANGWVVGGIDAAERFTMLTVMFAGNFAAAIAGGAVMGVTLFQTVDARAHEKRIPTASAAR